MHERHTCGQRSSLGEDLPKECARVRKLKKIYDEIGAPGVFASRMMEQALQRADKAMIEGDVVEMLRAFKELQGFTD